MMKYLIKFKNEDNDLETSEKKFEETQKELRKKLDEHFPDNIICNESMRKFSKFIEEKEEWDDRLRNVDKHTLEQELSNKKDKKEERVYSPNHYQILPNLEVIEVIANILGDEGFRAYCKGNIMKYVLRADKKNGLEDWKKAQMYLNWLVRNYEEEEGK